MWIQVRSSDGKTSVRIDNLSKLTKIEDLREKLVDSFNASPERQMLFYRGKQLVDAHTLFDYNVGLNDVIQIMVRAGDVKRAEKDSSSGDETSSNKENKTPEPMEMENEKEPVTPVEDYSQATYKVGDIVDCRDVTMGAWFEARIIKIAMATKEDDSTVNEQAQKLVSKDVNENTEKNENDVDIKETNTDKISETGNNITREEEPSCSESSSGGVKSKNDEFVYHCIYEGYEDDEPEKFRSCNVRPRCCKIIPFKDIQIGDKVMVNYNYDEPEARGYWYDAVVTAKRDTRTIKELHGTVFLGADLMPLKECKLVFVYEVYAIEKEGSQKNINNTEELPKRRATKPECDHCLDNEKKKCKECGCHLCGGKNEPDLMIMCDECDMAYHLRCLDPPLDSVPDVDEWYCPLCKTDDSTIVKAGETLKGSKKKAKMASQVNQTSRDWGKGMACAGRTKMCTIVPPNHFGRIPGIEVGSMWKFRVQVSEAGVHRPHVAGIHGREDEGAYSIVLSGGYEDDVDNGDSFTYTGSGGRDLSGNKRTAEQSCDQTLTRMNKALAKNCNASLDSKNGAEAKDWRGGKSVRVIRNCKGRKHSKYAPEEGNRYDGIYKIVKYWPDKGKSGFIVWRYLLQRDDPDPAPWTKAGKKKIDQLGLSMQYPEGYLESQKEKEKEKQKAEKGKGKKRKNMDSGDDSPQSSPEKKKKVASYEVSDEVSQLIKDDEDNGKLWSEALQFTKEGGQKFLAKVEELCLCICCQDLVFMPITTKCAHNICKSCLARSFKAEVYNCPACRFELGKGYSMATNQTLRKILANLFPGYEVGR